MPVPGCTVLADAVESRREQHRRLLRGGTILPHVVVVIVLFTCPASLLDMNLRHVGNSVEVGGRIPVELQVGRTVGFACTRHPVVTFCTCSQGHWHLVGRVCQFDTTIDDPEVYPTFVVVLFVPVVVAPILHDVLAYTATFCPDVSTVYCPVVVRTLGKSQHLEVDFSLSKRVRCEVSRFLEPCVLGRYTAKSKGQYSY